MNSKDKAEELIEKFNIPHPFQNLAKQCALIAVDEIINNLPLISEIQEYWQEVKQEIELL